MGAFLYHARLRKAVIYIRNQLKKGCIHWLHILKILFIGFLMGGFIAMHQEKENNFMQYYKQNKPVLISLLGSTVVWLFFVLLLSGGNWPTSSDLDSLVAAYAFIGLFFALHYQRADLQLQREELKQTREELKRTADANAEMAKANAETARANAKTAEMNERTADLSYKSLQVEVIKSWLDDNKETYRAFSFPTREFLINNSNSDIPTEYRLYNGHNGRHKGRDILKFLETYEHWRRRYSDHGKELVDDADCDFFHDFQDMEPACNDVKPK